MSDGIDVLVAGGGPAGSTAAMCAARAGLRVRLVEKATHPRFHIGESFLPRTLELIRELGLEEEFRQIPQTRKLGASLMFADDEAPLDFLFEDGLLDLPHESFNIERAPFDQMLLDAARRAGVDVREGVSVERVDRMDEQGVRVITTNGPVDARVLMDATGQDTIVGRHLGTRSRIEGFEKVAYFSHLTGVPRRPEPQDGNPIFAMCAEGWFWLIPLDEFTTSVGAVLDVSVAREAGVPARRILRWACGRCPAVWSLVRDTDMSDPNHVQADFTYTCRPYAGPGFMLVGDSAVFIDPVFSSGVCMGMMAGAEAGRLAPEMVAGGTRAKNAAKSYHQYIDRASSLYLRLIRCFYTPEFRELFMQGRGPLGVHKAIMTMLAGHVFPQAPASVRWRWRLFQLLLILQRCIGLVERRDAWSLLAATATNDECSDSLHTKKPEPVSA